MAEADRCVSQWDGWLRQMGGCAEAERWVAVPRQRDGWLRQIDRYHSEMDGRGREMGGCVEAERWVSL